MLFCLNFLGRPCSDADPDQHVLLSLAVIALLYVLGFFVLFVMSPESSFNFTQPSVILRPGAEFHAVAVCGSKRIGCTCSTAS